MNWKQLDEVLELRQRNVEDPDHRARRRHCRVLEVQYLRGTEAGMSTEAPRDRPTMQAPLDLPEITGDLELDHALYQLAQLAREVAEGLAEDEAA